MKVRVVLSEDEQGGYVAEFPALPGCVSQGESRQEALANLKEAIEGTLLTLSERVQLPPGAHELQQLEV